MKEPAPITRRGLWKRVGDRVFLCGTLGAEFDRWQRARAAVSAAEGYAAQMLGLEEVEKLMDSLEAEARSSLAPGESLSPRRSPGYGDMPLDLSREILETLDAPRKIGVTLTGSLLLAPSKSVTAISTVLRRGF